MRIDDGQVKDEWVLVNYNIGALDQDGTPSRAALGILSLVILYLNHLNNQYHVIQYNQYIMCEYNEYIMYEYNIRVGREECILCI